MYTQHHHEPMSKPPAQPHSEDTQRPVHQGPSLRVRTLFLLVTSIGALVAVVTTFALVSYNSARSTNVLKDAATNSVGSLAAIVQLRMARRVSDRFIEVTGTVRKTAQSFVDGLKTSNIRSYAEAEALPYALALRSRISAFPELASAGWVRSDGSYSLIIRANEAYWWYHTRPYEYLLNTWQMGADVGDPTLGQQVISNRTFDPRTRSYYKDAVQPGYTPNAITWVNVTYSVSNPEAYMFACIPYHPPPTATKPNPPLLGVVCAGAGLTWLSGFLKNESSPTDSVIFVQDLRTGYLYGTSHGSILHSELQASTNQVYYTTPVTPSDSDDARIRAADRPCQPDGRQREVDAGSLRYLCTSVVVEDGAGLRARVVVMTPREFFFATVEQASATADCRVEQGRKLTVGLCSLVLAIVVLAAAVFSFLVTRPLAVLASQMQRVAEMELSEENARSGDVPISRLREVREIQSQFRVMTNRLKEYKAFMPAAVFTKSSKGVPRKGNLPKRESYLDSGSDTSDHPAEFDDFDSGGRRNSGTRGISTAPASRTEGTGRANAPSTSSAVGTGRVLGLGLSHRSGTVMICDTDGLNERLQEMALRDVVTLHGMYVQAVSSAVARTGGALDGFQGDRLFASWNAFARIGQHSEAAARAALEIQSAVALMPTGPSGDQISSAVPLSPSTEFSPDSPSDDGVAVSFADPHFSSSISSVARPLNIRIALSAGGFAAGRMGCDTVRSFAVVGQVVTRCHLLARHAKTCKVATLVDTNVFENAKSAALMRPVDVIETARNEGPKLVYQVVREFRQTNDEWMYTLSEQERDQKRDALQQACDHLMRKEFQAAVASLASHCAASITLPTNTETHSCDGNCATDKANAGDYLSSIRQPQASAGVDQAAVYLLGRAQRMLAAGALLPVAFHHEETSTPIF
eukprot:TRINITY_DN2705_c0_g1_i5.p1 TRINITY_DN2705_c0_g1~~TRINITY_DN2705_c0_g1_i5.p1  ORF type:complete len:979 (+),score=134.17 TRINITY_DN2705_c0_g1_i5:179-2938(+)